MNLFNKKDNQELQSVVLVNVGSSGAQALGLVTRENFRDIPTMKSLDDKVAVYFPFSYGVGGYTFLVPKSQITKFEIPIEKAMSLAITGWVKADSGESQ